MTVGLGPYVRILKPGVYLTWCPACNRAHQWNISSTDHPDGKRWGWDGDLKRPSVEPEIEAEGCRFLLRAGVVHFRPECTHALAGQAVPLPVFPRTEP